VKIVALLMRASSVTGIADRRLAAALAAQGTTVLAHLAGL